MTETIIGILGIAILLYVLLGGADFGAGIVEWITGKKGIKTISQAIAPVWEANHIWIILAVVILFNGFPLVYTRITTYLHIPLLIILIGIIIRGSAFTFRYYDAPQEKGNQYYSFLFRFSSLLTPFFLGIVLGAVMLGKIPDSAEGTFYNVFMAPWLNGFSFATGLFLTLLFGWIASVYLIGEATDETYPLFARTSIILFYTPDCRRFDRFYCSELLPAAFSAEVPSFLCKYGLYDPGYPACSNYVDPDQKKECVMDPYHCGY